MNESVLFGKGYGESNLVRLSQDDWMIVDSCTNEDKRPAALDYLITHGFDPGVCVKVIVISHFHNDHIKGLSEIIECCKSSTVWLSNALNTEEFKQYLSAISAPDDKFSGTREISKIMSHFGALHKAGRLKYALADRCLYKNHDGLEVISLSPCDQDIAESNVNFDNLRKIGNNVPGNTNSAPLINPNNYSVVLRVYNPHIQHELLLGADLEVRKGAGWEAVCDCVLSPKPNRINLFKLPHHGSETGYHERTWLELINQAPQCILTTYNSSGLPREDMLKKYGERAKKIFCTSRPAHFKTVSNKKDILKSIDKSNSSAQFHTRRSNFGYLKVDDYLSETPTITPYGDALEIINNTELAPTVSAG
ncbi:hypothetical protein F3J42_19605 [Pantoea sp. Ap-959]|uniref:hypothetical protein n=1 Tax=unclassified Pantoea TaxID=2630326 RepID=UPI0011B03479|nr:MULTISPECIES: hypothetical protein [unclassified Pantoea]NIG36080.1 hypothetical protein [Pantoea sp. Ap-959]